MSDLIERVANAIVAKMAEPSPRDETPEQIARQIARAAIEAMREPTLEMLEAAYTEDAYWLHDISEIRSEWMDEISNVYRAMIGSSLVSPSKCEGE